MYDKMYGECTEHILRTNAVKNMTIFFVKACCESLEKNLVLYAVIKVLFDYVHVLHFSMNLPEGSFYFGYNVIFSSD